MGRVHGGVDFAGFHCNFPSSLKLVTSLSSSCTPPGDGFGELSRRTAYPAYQIRRASQTFDTRIADVHHTWGAIRTTNKQAEQQQQNYIQRKEQVLLQYGKTKWRDKCAKDCE